MFLNGYRLFNHVRGMRLPRVSAFENTTNYRNLENTLRRNFYGCYLNYGKKAPAKVIGRPLILKIIAIPSLKVYNNVEKFFTPFWPGPVERKKSRILRGRVDL